MCVFVLVLCLCNCVSVCLCVLRVLFDVLRECACMCVVVLFGCVCVFVCGLLRDVAWLVRLCVFCVRVLLRV